MESKRPTYLLKAAILIAAIAFLAASGCASAKKYHFDITKKKESCDMAHMGKNKYFYSSYYQNKLRKSTRRISGRK
jgi:hypothetical protein